MKEYIEDNFAIFGDNVYLGLLQSGDSVALRTIPMPPNQKYLDNGRVMMYQFQVLVRHSYELASYELMQDIDLGLDNLTNCDIISIDDSFEFVKCDSISGTNFVERTADGSIYTALFRAELHI